MPKLIEVGVLAQPPGVVTVSTAMVEGAGVFTSVAFIKGGENENAPGIVPTMLTVTTQLADPAMVAPEREAEGAEAFAVSVPPQVLPADATGATMMPLPVPKRLKLTLVNAVAFGLLMVKVSVDIPLVCTIDAGEKLIVVVVPSVVVPNPERMVVTLGLVASLTIVKPTLTELTAVGVNEIDTVQPELAGMTAPQVDDEIANGAPVVIDEMLTGVRPRLFTTMVLVRVVESVVCPVNPSTVGTDK